jgi:signal transduction histidine kinase
VNLHSTPLATKIAFSLVSLLGIFSLLAGLITFNASQDHEQKLLQSLSKDLAKNIVSNWPDVMASSVSEGRVAERNAILSMLMVVNPTIQVYVLDDKGAVLAYINTMRELQTQAVDIKPIAQFLQHEAFPIRGTDPLNIDAPRIFSAARFTPPRSHWPTANTPSNQGYLYILINSQMQRDHDVGSGLFKHFGGSLFLLLAAFIVTSLGGYLIAKKLTLHLSVLAQKMSVFQHDKKIDLFASPTNSLRVGDEIAILEDSFATMTSRLDAQSKAAERISHEHREVMAGVAHDLRLPMTALHGNLEALDLQSTNLSAQGRQALQAAMDQSNRVRTMSNELFALAALELTEQIIEFEWFSLEDLVGDIVQKFTQLDSSLQFTFDLIPPKPVKIKANIHLIERALTNLIDNAIKHGGGVDTPEGDVVITVVIDATSDELVRISIGDNGTGFSTEILQRLSLGASLRSPPLKRTATTIGGLGLAISQRIAKLHGGKLNAANRTSGGGLISLIIKKCADPKS